MNRIILLIVFCLICKKEIKNFVEPDYERCFEPNYCEYFADSYLCSEECKKIFRENYGYNLPYWKMKKLLSEGN